MSDERRNEHTLTSLEAMRLFERSGVPRSQRSIERYCRDGKLDCFLDPDEDRYYATPASVETLIGQMMEIRARHAPAEVPEAEPRKTSAPPFSNAESDPSGAADLETLRRENLDLKITNRAKDYLIDQMKADRRQLTDDFKNLALEYGAASRRIGELEATLRLAAPNEAAPAAPPEEPDRPEAAVHAPSE